MKENTSIYSNKEKIFLSLLLILVVLIMFSVFSDLDKDSEIRKAHTQKIVNNCSNNENSYSCYNTKFNQPIVSSHRNRYAIKEQIKRRDLLKNYKTTFHSCLEEYNNTSNLNLNKCHISLTLFQNDIKNKDIEKKLIKYQEDNIKYPLAYFRHKLFEVYIKKLGRR
jgi:hypothetical protein